MKKNYYIIPMTLQSGQGEETQLWSLTSGYLNFWELIQVSNHNFLIKACNQFFIIEFLKFTQFVIKMFWMLCRGKIWIDRFEFVIGK